MKRLYLSLSFAFVLVGCTLCLGSAAGSDEFEGRKILLLGSSTGMAREAGKLIVKRGGKVVFSSRTQAKLDVVLKDLGNPANAFGVTCDAGNTKDIERLVEESAKLMGGIDGFVYCPTYFGDDFMTDIRAVKDEGVLSSLNQKNQKMNVEQLLESVRLVMPHFLKEKSASFVAVSSIMGQIPSMRAPFYSAAKAAQDMYIKSLALAYARQNIRFNGFAAGVHLTEMVDGLPEPMLKDLEGRVPMGRGGSSMEGGENIAYLLSERSSYTTGTILVSDGGLLAYKSMSDPTTSEDDTLMFPQNYVKGVREACSAMKEEL